MRYVTGTMVENLFVLNRLHYFSLSLNSENLSEISSIPLSLLARKSTSICYFVSVLLAVQINCFQQFSKKCLRLFASGDMKNTQ